MNTLEAIERRRSIRRFKSAPFSRETIEKLLHAATQSPSAKNRQPWRFVVVESERYRAQMVRIMRSKIDYLKEKGLETGSSEWSAKAMSEAPVTIFVFNGESINDTSEVSWSLVDVQSIGAAIQNMLLAAQEMDLGSLWICDVYYAYEDLCHWLGRDDQMIAAVSIGYPDEAPGPRPRRPWEEVTTWLD